MVNDNVHNKTTGRCLCGQVQFEIHGKLRDIVNCHCSKCRKFHGNYGAYTSVKVENLKITEQKSLKWYKSPTDETENVHRGFCSECGSSLFWHPEDQPNISIDAHIAASVVRDCRFIRITYKPENDWSYLV